MAIAAVSRWKPEPSCAEYDLWGFALSFELAYTNVLNMLDLADVPVRSLRPGRGAGERQKMAYYFRGRTRDVQPGTDGAFH